jgi:hypothetical protein
MRRLASLVGIVLAVSACSGGGSGKKGDASVDSIIDVGLEWPDGCPPAAANDKGVGAACTRGGGECAKYGQDRRCTCDPALGALLAGVPCICTLAQFATGTTNDPCKDSVPANYCGSNATCCNVLNSAAYCVPNVCLINDACLVFVGPDGGT